MFLKGIKPAPGFVVCLLPLAISQAVIADQQVESPTDVSTLEEVVVTATRMGGGEYASKISQIDRQQLDQQLAITTDLSTVLTNTIASYAPSRQKMTSRGETMRGRKPLMMIDGVPQTNPLRDGDRTAHTIMPSMLESVEVIHSANSIHGLGAAGGTINLVTKTPEEGLKQTIELKANGQDSKDSLGWGANYGIEASNGKADVLMSIGVNSTGYFYDGDGNMVGSDSTQGDSQDSESANLFLKAGYNFDNDSRLSLTYNQFTQKNQGNLQSINVGSPGNDTDVTISEERDQPWTPAETEVKMVNVAYEFAISDNTEAKVQGYYQEFYAIFGGGCWSDFYDPDLDPGTNPGAGTEACGIVGDNGENYFWDQSRNNSTKQGIKASFITTVDEFTFGYGVDAGQDTTKQDMVQTDRVWVPESVYSSVGVYAQTEWQLTDKLLLSGGIRQEQAELEVDDYQTLYGYGDAYIEGGTQDYSETLFNAGLSYWATDDLRLRASYSQGFGMPDVGRALRDPGDNVGSVDEFLTLAPVVTDNYEVGFDFTQPRYEISMTAYIAMSDYGNTLTFVQEGDDSGQYVLNRSPTQHKGVEGDVKFFATEADTIGLAFSYNQGTEEISDDNGNSVGDKDLTGVNAGVNRMLLSWEHRFNNGITGRIQSSTSFDGSYDDEYGNQYAEFDGYTLVDISVIQPLSVGQLSYGIQNVTNEQYVTYYSQTEKATSASSQFAGLGRTWTVGYAVSF